MCLLQKLHAEHEDGRGPPRLRQHVGLVGQNEVAWPMRHRFDLSWWDDPSHQSTPLHVTFSAHGVAEVAHGLRKVWQLDRWRLRWNSTTRRERGRIYCREESEFEEGLIVWVLHHDHIRAPTWTNRTCTCQKSVVIDVSAIAGRFGKSHRSLWDAQDTKLIIFGPLEGINSSINLNLDFGFNHTISGVDLWSRWLKLLGLKLITQINSEELPSTLNYIIYLVLSKVIIIPYGGINSRMTRFLKISVLIDFPFEDAIFPFNRAAPLSHGC